MSWVFTIETHWTMLVVALFGRRLLIHFDVSGPLIVVRAFGVRVALDLDRFDPRGVDLDLRRAAP